MKSIYLKKEGEKRLKKIKKITRGCWINLTNPSREELAEVRDKTDVLMEHLISPLDEGEKARIDKEENSTLVVFRVPHKERKETGHVEINTIPFGILISKYNIITVCLERIKVVKDFEKGKVKNFYTTKKTRVVLQMLQRINKYFQKYLLAFEKQMEEIEDEARKSLRNEEILKLLNLQKSLVYFDTSIVSNASVLEAILRGKVMQLYDEDEELLEDIIVENNQSREMTAIYKNIISSTMNAYSSVIGNNLNTIMKILTSITILLSIPTMIASLYGMNVGLPLENNPQAFSILLLISLVISSITAVFFVRQRLL